MSTAGLAEPRRCEPDPRESARPPIRDDQERADLYRALEAEAEAAARTVLDNATTKEQP
jgi:hypothetical protein